MRGSPTPGTGSTGTPEGLVPGGCSKLDSTSARGAGAGPAAPAAFPLSRSPSAQLQPALPRSSRAPRSRWALGSLGRPLRCQGCSCQVGGGTHMATLGQAPAALWLLGHPVHGLSQESGKCPCPTDGAGSRRRGAGQAQPCSPRCRQLPASQTPERWATLQRSGPAPSGHPDPSSWPLPCPGNWLRGWKLPVSDRRASARPLRGDSPPQGSELLAQAFSKTVINVTCICPATALLPSWSLAFPPHRAGAACPSPGLSRATESLLNSHSAAEFIRECQDFLPSFITTYALF